MKRFYCSAAVLLAGFVSQLHAYELRTHALMMQEATNRSVMFTGRSIELGLFNNPSLGNTFADIASFTGVPPQRTGRDYELKYMPGGSVPSFNKTARAWVMRGVIREDDGGTLASWKKGEPFTDDPFGKLNRFCSHFYDPWFDRALEGGCGGESVVEKSPNWGIGTADWFAADVVPAPAGYRNHQTVFTARESMFRALTMKDSGTGLDLFQQGTQQALDWQKIYWATTFRTLGQVMHLVQDSANPQHTRNEPHAFENAGYEERTEQRAVGDRVALFDVATQSVQTMTPPALELRGKGSTDPTQPYPIPNFNRYSDYWATVKGTDLSGKGIGNYSNREFFTIGTSIGMPSNYPNPPRDTSSYDAQLEQPCELGPYRQFKLYGNVQDKQTGQVDRIRMQSYSLLMRSYGRLSRPPVFTMDPCVYDDYANLLLPRAVAYSAGVMDYFFRGKVQIELPPEQVYAVEDFSTWTDGNAGFKQLKMMVKNSTLDIGSARQLTGSQGHLYAVLRFRRNRCLEYPTLNGAPYRDYSDGQLLWDNTCRTPGVQLQPFPEIIVSNRIDAPADFDNSLQEVVFTFPNPLPFNATDVDLQVVYRGKLGTENNAVAVGLEHISEPNFFNIDNNSDCLKGIATCPYGDTSSNCSFNPTLRLPFPNITQPGWRPVASVNLGAGEYARVVFLTRTAYREDLGGGSFDEVLKNQEFPYTVIVTWIPGGDTETWLPGQQISYFGKNRRLTTGSGPLDSFGHRGWGIYGSDCGGRSCGGFEWAATQCTPIPAQPKQVTIMFPNP